ncbi:MAG: dephospho-CoA kinase [Bacteroidales bacterium]|nr:dephospho-CoA kinase [Bacteroidales bacterium]
MHYRRLNMVVVITGGIGSGKSEVCRIFRRLGVNAVYNADQKVKALYGGVPGLLDTIERSLRLTLRNQDGSFCPASLAKVIFNDRAALQIVEKIVFPYLKEDFNTWVKDYADEHIVLFESATILEKEDFDGFGDRVILVDAPVELRKCRAADRDRLPKERIEERMSNQQQMNSFADCQDRVDYIIVNDGTLEELENKVRIIYNKLINN